jgi:heavy metal translocating P-type ATPase
MAQPSSACDLCGLPVLGRPIRDREHDFCCEGCRRVYVTAEDAGISDLLAGPEARRARSSGAAQRKAAAALAAGARRETLRVNGMWCASCGLVLEDALMALPGVLDAEASYAASLARVTWDPEGATLESITDRISLLGYSASPAREAARAKADTDELFLRLFVSAAVGMWVMWPTFFVLWPAFATQAYASVFAYELFVGALSAIVLLYGGWPFLIGAWRAALVRRATMDTLVVLGTWTAWLYSAWATATSSGPTYFESAAMIATIVLLGRWLEALGTRDASASLAALAEGAAENAWLVPKGGRAEEGAESGTSALAGVAGAEQVALSTVGVGDVVAVRPGERVPVDGVVLGGASEIDRSRLTGEPLPAHVAEGDEVWAGTVNLSGVLTVEVGRIGAETLAGRLATLAEDAAFAKSHTQRIADAVAGVFVPVVIAIAGAALLISLATGVGVGGAVERAVAVLVVSCPCALGLATPLAVANAIGAGARRGLLVRGGPALERAGSIVTVAFDKTGTLTAGTPEVAGFVPADLDDAASGRLLGLAAALEAGDPHPVAGAIERAAGQAVAEATAAHSVADAVERRPGLGLVGRVGTTDVAVGSERLLDTVGVTVPPALMSAANAAREGGALVVWVAAGGELLGGIRLADHARAEAATAAAALHARGVRTAIVSGDAKSTCDAIATELGIDEVWAEVLPHEKESAVRALAERGSVAFVGDGINDAAALSAADLAVAVGGGSDVAVLSADVVLTGAGRLSGEHALEREGDSPLAALPALLDIAAATRRVIAENLWWAFSYNLVAIPLAATGRLSPVVAAAAMAGSSLAVVANSWRLQFAGGKVEQ